LQITSRAWPKVTVDASLLGYKFLGGANFHPANGIYLICAALANHNIDVLAICDPPTRHHSKRAHHQRAGKKEKILLLLVLHLMELARFQDDNGMIKQVTREIRKLEKADCQMSLLMDFVEELQHLFIGYRSQGRGEVSLEMSPFQADPSIANVAIDGGFEAILSGDSDFAMYIGPGGPDEFGDIMLRDIKVNHRQSTTIGCSLVTGQSKVASKIEELFSNRGLRGVFPTRPKFPLFDNVDDPKIRALIGIALGCDALSGGVPALGASVLQDLLCTCNWNDSFGLHLEIVTKLASRRKAVVKDPNVLLCLVNSIIYEKTISEVGYMHHIPERIEKTMKHLQLREQKCLMVQQ